MKTFNFILILAISLACAACLTDAFAQNTYTNQSCINNTKDEPQCKDCCDCLDADAATRKACRDLCPTHDFTLNSGFITVNALSTLGPNGDYSAATSAGNEQACKEYCDGSSALACGDRRFCRDACAKTYGGNQSTTTAPVTTTTLPQPPPDQGGGGISIDQAISDEAQQNTISFDGLAFLTGNLCGDSFLPPGKVADFSGFQYFRDTDPTNMGHNTDFVTIIAFNILNILTTDQRSILITLANNQVSQINEYGYKRFPLMKAFRRLIAGDLPTGMTGLDRSAVMAYSAELYQLDGQISYDRAKTLGTIIRSMTSEQKAKIDALKALNGVGNWDKTLADPLKGLNLAPDVNVAVMTYASEMYSWYAGSVESDTYFCPERQGTYFGSFYMKDAPAMAAGPDFTIPSTLTADMGSNFIKLLTTDQAALVSNLVNIQRSDLNEIVATRRSISTQLRRFITESSVDSATVLSLAKRYGELDGEIVYNYATNFVSVNKTLSANQKTQLTSLRETWNTIPCLGAYLYSAKINMPEIMNTDFLFGASVTTTTVTVTTTLAATTTTKPSVTTTTSAASTSTVSVTTSTSAVTTTTVAGGGVVSAGSIKQLGIIGLLFAEGPASDASGNIFFSDITANKIYKWSTDGQLSTFITNSGGANGLFFDRSGNLIACQGTNGRLVSIDPQGNVTVLADKYNGARFNEPNDLWIDAKGGIYFSDPLYIGTSLTQDGEHVYYLTPKRDNLMRVVNDMVRPNGLIGTPDGKVLYVADHGAGKTYKYAITQNGSLSDKTLFVSSGSDGMTIDNQGNIYLTTGNTVLVYNSSGSLIETITVPLQPTNVCFGGKDGQTLFITAKTAVYALPMRVKGVTSFGPSLAGDINGDGKIDLADAILALQIAVEIIVTGPVNLDADVNGDRKIGTEEAIYILQVLLNLRQPVPTVPPAS